MICDLTGKQLRLVVDEIVDRWREGDPPDACAVLAEYPQLRERHSLAVDLAYEEYCLRQESGEALNPRQFCSKFSQLQHSVARMLNLHQVLQNTSLALNLPGKEQVDWPEIGDHWLDWTLVEEIGRGAFSRVFLAEEPSLGNRRVVVKCATSGAGEAFLLGKLAHGSVMPIHSIRHDEPRQLVGICMPYVGRVTLADVLNRLIDPSATDISAAIFSPQLGDWRTGAKKPNAAAAGAAYTVFVARLIEKVARGLAVAHRENVLHGDIKPSNVILSFAGEPMLVDFNLSDDGGEARRIGGTPPYMAPERLALLTPAGSVGFERTEVELRLRSDVFSLGVVLYELLYGDTPYDFVVEDLTAEYRTKNSSLFPERSAAGESVPRELTELITQAIALDPEQRCLTVEELADELARFANKYSPKPKAKQLAWPSLVAFALLITAAMSLFVVSNLGSAPNELDDNRPSAEPRIAIEPEESAERQALRAAIDYLDQRVYDEASRQLLKISRKLRPPEVEAWLGYSLALAKQDKAAKHYFSQASPDSDASGVLWHNIGSCELNDNDPSAARQSFMLAVNCNPYEPRSYLGLAIAKNRIAINDRSQPLAGTYDDLACALLLLPEDPHLVYEAARIYAYGLRWDRDQFKGLCYKYTSRALELRVPLSHFEGVFANPSEFEALVPEELPQPAVLPSTAAMFLPPPFNLRDALKRLP